MQQDNVDHCPRSQQTSRFIDGSRTNPEEQGQVYRLIETPRENFQKKTREVDKDHCPELQRTYRPVVTPCTRHIRIPPSPCVFRILTTLLPCLSPTPCYSCILTFVPAHRCCPPSCIHASGCMSLHASQCHHSCANVRHFRTRCSPLQYCSDTCHVFT